MQNGDGIFNTFDDQFYNALNAGNDGIYGTMDDFSTLHTPRLLPLLPIRMLMQIILI